MTVCNHETLELLPAVEERLRCTRCHLTIAVGELDGGCCPECLEEAGIKHNDFEVLDDPQSSTVRYRCESCGVIVESC